MSKPATLIGSYSSTGLKHCFSKIRRLCYYILVFRGFSLIRLLLTAILPLTLLWSWAACPALCDEIVEHHQQQTISLKEKPDENFILSFDSEGCPFTANAAIIEARQSNVLPVLTVSKAIKSAPHEFAFVPAAIFAADVRQNSPPRASSCSPPLYLTHRAFRI